MAKYPLPPADSTGSNMERQGLEGEEVRRIFREGEKLQRKLSKNDLVPSNVKLVSCLRGPTGRGPGEASPADRRG